MSKTSASSRKLWPQLFTASHVKPSMDEDQKLMVLTKRGDKQAYAKLYEKFKGPIMSYVFQMTHNQTQTEELVQEIFLKVYRVRETYEPSAKFSTWLWTIARNTCLDLLRKRSQGENAEVPFDIGPSEDGVSIEEHLAAPLLTAEDELLAQTDLQNIERCMSKLPPPQREALSLRTVSELSYDEIASTLKISLAAVKTLIFRAKQSLIECMKRGVKS